MIIKIISIILFVSILGILFFFYIKRSMQKRLDEILDNYNKKNRKK